MSLATVVRSESNCCCPPMIASACCLSAVAACICGTRKASAISTS